MACAETGDAVRSSIAPASASTWNAVRAFMSPSSAPEAVAGVLAEAEDPRRSERPVGVGRVDALQRRRVGIERAELPQAVVAVDVADAGVDVAGQARGEIGVGDAEGELQAVAQVEAVRAVAPGDD